MKLIKEFLDSEFPTQNSKNITREAVRIVMIDDQWLTPIIYASVMEHYKIPGWWIDKWEDINTALQREALEEAGCEIEVLWEIWKIIETRSSKKYQIWHNLHQTSYCYYWKVTKKLQQNFTQRELEKWFELKWMK